MSNKKISVLILGGGALGKVFTKVFNTGEFDLAVAKRKKFNSEDAGKGYLTYEFDAVNCPPYVAKDFDYIVNCIGVIPQKIDEACTHSKLNALLVNSAFPYQLAKNCPNSRIIHISTSHVFALTGGSKTENDWPQPLTTYEKTKFTGEVWAENVMNLRCSVVGPGGGLFEWFKTERKQKGRVEGYTNHMWNGLTSLKLAEICRGIIRDELFCGGIQHIVPNGKVSKHQLLWELNQYPWGESDKAAEIVEAKADCGLDRTLGTVRLIENMALWRGAGSLAPLDIRTQIREMAIWVEENK
jgi:dTDP-4-dehydrorhamnose reductase